MVLFRLSQHVVLLGGNGEAGDKTLSWSELLGSGDSEHPPSPEYVAEQPCCLPLTSGTTGKPKVVVHTHESLLASVQAAG